MPSPNLPKSPKTSSPANLKAKNQPNFTPLTHDRHPRTTPFSTPSTPFTTPRSRCKTQLSPATPSPLVL